MDAAGVEGGEVVAPALVTALGVEFANEDRGLACGGEGFVGAETFVDERAVGTVVVFVKEVGMERINDVMPVFGVRRWQFFESGGGSAVFEDDDAMRIDGADSAVDTVVEREESVWGGGAPGFVEEVVGGDGGLVGVAGGDGSPEGDGTVLERGVEEEAIAIGLAGGVIGRLAAGSAMQIEDAIEAAGSAVRDSGIEEAPAIGVIGVGMIIVFEDFVGERDADTVHAHAGDEIEVELRDVVTLVYAEEVAGAGGAEAAGENLADVPVAGKIVAARANVSHPELDEEPGAEIDATEMNRRPRRINYKRAVGSQGQELRRSWEWHWMSE